MGIPVLFCRRWYFCWPQIYGVTALTLALLTVCAVSTIKEASAGPEPLPDGKYKLVLGAGPGHKDCSQFYPEGLNEEFEVEKGRVKQRRRPIIRIKMRNIKMYGYQFTANFLGPTGAAGPHAVRMEGYRAGKGFEGEFVGSWGQDHCRGRFRLTSDALPSGVATTADGPHGDDVESARKVIGTGTGFYISASGHVLTNENVIGSCKKLEVQKVGKPLLQASVVAVDTRNDLAVLQAAEPSATFARFWSGRIRQGDEIVVYGFPLLGALASSGNATTGNITALTGLADDTRLLQISAPIQQGNSGGPVLNKSGGVMGVVLGKLDATKVYKVVGDIPQNVNFAIKGNIVVNFLDTYGIEYESAAIDQEFSVPDLADRARSVAVMVFCLQ